MGKTWELKAGARAGAAFPCVIPPPCLAEPGSSLINVLHKNTYLPGLTLPKR